jgi:lysophospholipase L1-like esterase
MRKLLWILVLVFTIMSFTQNKKQKIIFFGDSITQAGVQAGGYIIRIDSICKAEGQKENYEFVGSGIGGNKVYDLYLRLEDDVLSKNPDVVVIYIGVNDIWHKSTQGTGTDADKFVKFYEALIKKLKDKNIKIILCTPAVIGEKTDNSNPQDGDLNEYSKVIRSLSQKNKLQIVDLRNSFLQYNAKHNLKNYDRGMLTTDRVHLNEKGNQLVADEMWKVIKQ